MYNMYGPAAASALIREAARRATKRPGEDIELEELSTAWKEKKKFEPVSYIPEPARSLFFYFLPFSPSYVVTALLYYSLGIPVAFFFKKMPTLPMRHCVY